MLHCGYTCMHTTDSSKLNSSYRVLIQKTAVVFATLLAVSGILYFLYLTRAVLLGFVVAFIFAAALSPLVSYLEKRHMKRMWASLAALSVTVIVLFGILGSILTPLITEGFKLVGNAPQIAEQIAGNAKLAAFNEQYHIVDKVREASNQLGDTITGAGGPALGVVGRVVGGISEVVIAIIFAFFMLVDGPATWQRLLGYLSPQQAAQTNRIGKQIMKAISGFVTGNLLISLIAAIVTLVTLLILGVPYAFALAALVGLFDLIPLIGAAVATIFVGLVALSKGVTVAVIVVIVLLVYQFVEGHFIQPVVYSRSVSLSALLIVVASVVGAELAGVLGVLLAIPVAAVLQILVTEFFLNNKPEHAE